MNNDKLIEVLEMDCPICNKTHLIEKRQRESTCLVKDEKVIFTEIYFLCNECDEDDNQFVSTGIIVQNLLSSKEAYRINKGLLNSN